MKCRFPIKAANFLKKRKMARDSLKEAEAKPPPLSVALFQPTKQTYSQMAITRDNHTGKRMFNVEQRA